MPTRVSATWWRRIDFKKPCHVVCELHSASVPVALILSPAVAQVLDGVVWQAQVGAASQHLHRYGLVDRLKSFPADGHSRGLERLWASRGEKKNCPLYPGGSLLRTLAGSRLRTWTAAGQWLGGRRLLGHGSSAPRGMALVVGPFVRFSGCPFLGLFSVCPFLWLSVCPFVDLSFCPSVLPSFRPPVLVVHLDRLSIGPSVLLSFCPFGAPSRCCFESPGMLLSTLRLRQ